MSTIDERKAYLNNPYFTGHIYGNFSPFYVTITICTLVLLTVLILNIYLTCCSKYRKYWQDRHTGNRWLVSIWSATPHNQPPLDFTELKDASHFARTETQHIFNEEIDSATAPIHQEHQYQYHHQQERPARPSRQQREEYVELQKRESDI
ncbi:uncharacterized protein LOC129947311 [Eupeodes corollae]|uniref:uncharacterized protein LOC129947311 n=1 Tax=Eupeodes corollae TaxID=290404 RepID=UPI002491FFC0|nr:uncharacterized protein LOC129947311 [Eupeodes corollae]